MGCASELGGLLRAHDNHSTATVSKDECPLWMAPAMQEVIRHYGALVGCSLLSGLLMQPFETAGPDGVGELGPNLLIRL
jgi:hypothetical protein